MIAPVAAAALTPWIHPLAFRPLPGWQKGASGNVPSQYGPSRVRKPKESSAWTARNVRSTDAPTADPPAKTLTRLPANGIVVWAVTFQGLEREPQPIRLSLEHAKHFQCCDGERVAGGMYELHGYGPRHTYSVYIRVYFGSRPTAAARAEAQHAVRGLELPRPR